MDVPKSLGAFVGSVLAAAILGLSAGGGAGWQVVRTERVQHHHDQEQSGRALQRTAEAYWREKSPIPCLDAFDRARVCMESAR